MGATTRTQPAATPRQSTGGAYIRWFEDLSRSDTPDVDGKGANLGEVTQAGIDSISVNPDVIEVTRRNIAVAERRLLLVDARRRLETEVTGPGGGRVS